jgi:putative protein kinase ArgK-like GTPase of G3E family
VRSLVDGVVLLLQPETGDDLQWEKAGLFEVADVLVIHKADLPGAERVEAQVRATLALSMAPAPPVLRVSARTGTGVAELWQAIHALPLRRLPPAVEEELLRRAQQTLTERFHAAWRGKDPALLDLAQRRQRGEVVAEQVGEMVLRRLIEQADPVN